MSSHREQLRELYKQYNPAKLQDVDDLLAKYSGCVARNAEAHSLNTSLTQPYHCPARVRVLRVLRALRVDAGVNPSW
jgi:hypothetical protein